MFFDKFVLTDGTELQDSIVNVSWTTSSNSDSDITPGSVCAGAVEIEFWVNSDSALSITQGTVLTYFKVDADSGKETKIGIFTCDKPEKNGANKYTVTAYDNVTLLDVDVSDWLNSFSFPVSLSDFASALAAKCNLSLANSPRLNGSYQIQAFTGSGVKGRDLMKQVCSASGCFCIADADGKLSFNWYKKNNNVAIAPTESKGHTPHYYLFDVVSKQLFDNVPRALITAPGEKTPDGIPYFINALTFSDFTVQKIDKVQVKQTDSDVGVVYPADETGTNAIVIQGNQLLATTSDAALRPCVKNLYEGLNDIVYVPCSNIETPETLEIKVGDIVTVSDGKKKFVTWITSVKHSGNKCTFESVGNANRNTTTAVNNAQYNVNQKIAEVKAGVDGISAKLGEYTTKSETESLVDIALDKIQLSIAEKTGIYNLFDGNVWVKDGSGSSIGTTGSVTIDGNTATIVAPDSTEPDKRQGVYWNVPNDKLSYTKGKTLKCSIEYKVNSELSKSSTHASHILVWANYASGNINKIWVYLSTSTTVEPVGDWKTATVEIAFKDEVPTRIYAFAYLYGGTGGVSVRNPIINVSASKEKASTVTLEKSGVTISASELNLGEYATTSELQVGLEGIQGIVTNLSDDYTQFKQTYNSFTATVVKNNEVRSKFALDTSSATIESGTITFKGNTLIVDSSNFKLTSGGSISITGSFYSTGSTGNASISDGIISLDALNADGNRYKTILISRTVSTYPSGSLTVYSRRANGTVGSGVTLQGSATDSRIFMYNAYGDTDVYLTTGTGNSCYVNGGFNVKGTGGLGVSYKISCQDLNCWGSKSGVAKTSFGNLQIGAIESPEPMYADVGSGVCDERGLCYIYADPRYAESVSRNKYARWIVTPVDSSCNLWVEKIDSVNAVVHGKKNQKFDWMCFTPKNNGATDYAEVSDSKEPLPTDESFRVLDSIEEEHESDNSKLYDFLESYKNEFEINE